jgi:hypothetical protein
MRDTRGLIPAEVWSANLAIKAKVDAAPWFKHASREEVGALAADGWCGRGEKISLVSFLVPLEEEVELVVAYARKRRTSVMFSVDACAAVTWILEHEMHLIGNVSPLAA